MQPQSTSQLNTMVIEYEGIGIDTVKIEVEITDDDISDFILKKQFKHGFSELESSNDFATRVIASSFKDCIKELSELFGIKTCLGWYEIVEDSKEFYEYMKAKHRKGALEKTAISRERMIP
jgi:hypothetical protein